MSFSAVYPILPFSNISGLDEQSRSNCAHRTIIDKSGGRVRYEKLETLLRVALDLRGTAEGLSFEDIQNRYGGGRRTAERMRKCKLDCADRYPTINNAARERSILIQGAPMKLGRSALK